ncbi:MAG: 3'(2'),5'-bisphosphate nucleotidase CysQ [Thermodesulforhabdaceae bacterium]|jgi:3'(2'), 5'-bisphosphate nucleotidase
MLICGKEIKEELMLDLCRRVGDVICYHYEKGFETFSKEDKSPLTSADLASHQMIIETLRSLYPDIPVVSEESASQPYSDRQSWETFWLVDPLDGTKEFIHRQDEFTVNIALIQKGICQFGIVHVPVYRLTYLGYRDKGSWRIDEKGEKIPIYPSPVSEKGRKIKVGISRFHLDDRTKAFLETFKEACEPVVCGSALKFCYVADGSIDLYLRFGPTWEWDTAAGQSVVEAAGGAVIDLDGNDLIYNKPSLKNGPLIVTGDKEWFINTDFWKWIKDRALI